MPRPDWVGHEHDVLLALWEANGYELLHRDVTNVCRWFAGRGIEEARDPDRIFGEIL